MKLLFVCSYGQVRSVCGAYLFADYHDTKYLGLSSRYTEEYIEEYSEWADKIIVMEDIHLWYYCEYYPRFLSKVECVYIVDSYGDPNHSELKKEIYNRTVMILSGYSYDHPNYVTIPVTQDLELDDVGFFLNRMDELK